MIASLTESGRRFGASLWRLLGFASADERRAEIETGLVVGRVPLLGVVAANLMAGMLFGPAFGSALPHAVWVPVVAVSVVLYLCTELSRFWSPFEQWRAVASVVLGLLAIVETTLHSTTASELPTGASVRALYEGVRRSWLLTLQSTLPAHPQPSLVVFVPMLVLAAGLLSVQVLTRTSARLLGLLPPVLVAGLAQAYYPLAVGSAAPVVLVFAVLAAAVLGRLPRLSVRVVSLVVLAAVPAVVLGAFAGAALDPASRTAYALQDDVASPPDPVQLADPLDDIAPDLETPAVNLFRVRGDVSGTDRWPIIIDQGFNGTSWTPTGPLRKLGARLTIDRPTAVSVSHHTAQVAVLADGLTGPWLPTQIGLESVSGLSRPPLVFEDNGTLSLQPVTERTHYRIGYITPTLPRDLASARLTPHLAQSVNNLDIPPEVTARAESVSKGAAPTFGTALALEKYLRTHYKLAQPGPSMPGGHGLPQLVHFIDESKVGTSEQFATAYVLLARILGIPSRVAVGFRQPAQSTNGWYTITSHDIFAWPEVSVDGVGWLPLDPTAGARTQVAQQTPLDQALQRARNQVAPPAAPKPKPAHHQGSLRQSSAPTPDPNDTNWFLIALIVVGGLIVLAVLATVSGIPIAKWLRNRARRRRRGNSAIVSAWLETRDRLRDHGIDVSRDMTVRDVGRISRELMDPQGVQAMERLGDLVDSAMWAGTGAVNRYPPDVAWGAHDTVRHSLAERPVVERLVAGFRVTSLRPLP